MMISVIVPFLNEEECIGQCCAFLDNLAIGKEYEIEAIFVDDGSSDKTGDKIKAYQFNHCKKVKLVTFSKNFGAHPAILAGFTNSTGDYCINIGADLQEPDNMIDVAYEKMKNNDCDAVYIERNSIERPVATELFSGLYAYLLKKSSKGDYGEGINNILFNEKILEQLKSNPDRNNSVLLQIISLGFKHVRVGMDYKPRTKGASKWTFSKKVKLFIDIFVSYSYMPIRLVSVLGISMSLLGFAFMLYVLVSRLMNPTYSVAGYPTLVSVMLLGFGITNISLGIIAEYLWRTLDTVRNRPVYVISEIDELK